MSARGSGAAEVVVRLLEEANRVAASAFDGGERTTREPGLYAWFVDVEGATELSEGATETILSGLIYAGQAGAGSSKASLGQRIGRNHLSGRITGSTFRMTLAALLADRLGLSDEGGDALAGDGEARLSEWMRRHLAVSWVPVPDRAAVSPMEHELLAAVDPPLNLMGMARSPLRQVLSERRRRPLGGRVKAKADQRAVGACLEISLVGCVKAKRSGTHAAKDLYASPLFRGRRRWVERSGMPWWILSAKFGLVAPDRPIPSYDQTLNEMSRSERATWGSWVLEDLRQELGSFEGSRVEIHAGALYVGAIQPGLASGRATVSVPTAGLGVGEQLRFYKRGAPS